MSELKLISPLLDNMHVAQCFSSAGRCVCYLMEQDETQEQFVLKHIAIPESETKVQALLLTGAVADEAAAQTYYQGIADDIRHEIRKLQALSGHSSVASWTGYQIEPREDAVGFDVYLLMPLRKSLQSFVKDNAITQLQALNLGLDLCNALSTLRDAGYLFQDLKPENIFVDHLGRHMIGDLGLVALEDLRFTAVPDHYLSDFSAPELYQLTGELNTTVDLYAVGMILYYIFNGNRIPFADGDVTAEQAQQRRIGGEALPAPLYADYELAEIIAKACAPDPLDRYQNPGELRQALVYYMQKNTITDQLLVPPIVLDEMPQITEANMDEDAALADDAPQTADEAEQAQEAAEPAPADAEAAAAVIAAADEATPPPAEAASDADVASVAEAVSVAEAASDAETELCAQDVDAAEVPAEDTDVPAGDEEASAEDAEVPAESTEAPQPVPAEGAAAADMDMSLGELLESVSTMLEEPQPQPPTIEPEDEEDEDDVPPKKRRSKVWIPIVIAVLVLGLLGAGIWWLYHNWYTIPIEGLEITETTADTITVSYALDGEDPDLSWICTDTYGNSYAGTAAADTVVFTDLPAGMQYKITMVPGRYHRLIGEPSVTGTTSATTDIVSFSATTGGNSTTAEINMVVSGPEPEVWTLTYSSDNNDSGTVEFEGHTVTIPGLQLHRTYTFELQPPAGEDFYLSGTTTAELTMIANVQAKDLVVAGGTADSLTITWASMADQPEFWQVSCEGSSYSQQAEVEGCTATFTGTKLDTAYTFTVSAIGLETPLQVTLPANATIITELNAAATDPGTIALNWTFGGAMPAGGWNIRYTLENGDAVSGTITTSDEGAALIPSLAPNATYIVELLAANGDTLIGNAPIKVTTPEAAEFTEYGFSTEASELALYPLPEAEEWTYADLSDATDDFTVGDPIAFALTAPSDADLTAEDEVTLTIVIRSEDGLVHGYRTVSGLWKDLWADGNFIGQIDAPLTDGTYRLEIYVNNQYVGRHALYLAPDPDAPQETATEEQAEEAEG